MTKVFIGGSRRLSRLNKDVQRRVDNIIDKGLTVLVGDANGADKAVQRYLETKRYHDVVVYFMEGQCRNNVGKWPARQVKASDPSRRDFAYYSTKDREMAAEADYGLMLWDTNSRGTLSNIINLVRQNKPVVVYVAPRRAFYTLRHSNDLAEMVRKFDPDALHRIDRQLQSVTSGSGSDPKTDNALMF